jgi:hypothetical protein
MTRDLSRFVVGDEWAYRLRDDAPSEHVQIVAVVPKRTTARLDILFLDDRGGRVENVPSSRLRVRWSEVARYDSVMANWARIDDYRLDSTERACAEEVYALLIPSDVATLDWLPVPCATTVHDIAGLSKLIHVPMEPILESITWFEHPDGTMLSPRGTLLIAEAACRATPMLVLDLVAEQEARSRHKCKHGADGINPRTREKHGTLPAYEYDLYRRFDRPRHELLRQWCGHRAITVHERLMAAEAETERLDILVTELIRALAEAGDKKRAKSYAEDHECERITPETIRPTVDRPLHPSEIPVREVHVRRRWW